MLFKDTYFVVKLFIASKPQRKYRSCAGCMAYGFVPVFNGSLKAKNKPPLFQSFIILDKHLITKHTQPEVLSLNQDHSVPKRDHIHESSCSIRKLNMNLGSVLNKECVLSHRINSDE